MHHDKRPNFALPKKKKTHRANKHFCFFYSRQTRKIARRVVILKAIYNTINTQLWNNDGNLRRRPLV